MIWKNLKNLNIKRSFILAKNGESEWGINNKFIGWSDIPLSKQGVYQSMRMGLALQFNNLNPTIIFTSKLQRSLDTSILLKNYSKMDPYTPITEHWRLNEKHYGDLDGVERKIIEEKYDKKFIEELHNSYTQKPPDIERPCNHIYSIFQNKYYFENIKGESKKMILERLLPLWNNDILSSIFNNEMPIIVTHKHTARVLIKYIKNIDDEDFYKYKFPDKKMLLIELNKDGFYESSNEIEY